LPPNDRYIYHWIVLVVAKIIAPYQYGAVDVACIMQKWKTSVDARAVVAQKCLSTAVSSARREGVSLRRALTDATRGPAAGWLEPILAQSTTAINQGQCRPVKGPAMTISDVICILQGFIFILEVYGNVDVDLVSLL
jgi:hypothetical protein